MQVNQHQVRIKAADVPLEKLAGDNQLSQSQKVGEVSRQFEAVLLRQILTEAQKPAFKSNIAGSSVSNSIYQDLFTQQLADQISRSGSVGLGRSLETQLQHQLKDGRTADASGQSLPTTGKLHRGPSHVAAHPKAGQAKGAHPMHHSHAHHSPDTAKRQPSS